MATCPDCGGYLGDRHVCTRARRRRSQRGLIATALVGAAGGVVLSFLVTAAPHSLLASSLTAVLGAVVAVSIFRAVPR